MKRFFVILLCCMMILPIGVIANAAEESPLKGTWKMKSGINVPSDLNYDWGLDFELANTGEYFMQITVVNGEIQFWYPDVESNLVYLSHKNHPELEFRFFDNECFDGVANYPLSQFLAEYAVKTDFETNFPSSLPALPVEVDTGDYEHLIMRVGEEIKLYSYHTALEESYYVWGYTGNDDVHLEAQKGRNTGNAYVLENGEWVYSGILSGDYVLGKRTDIIYSSVIIYDENGEYFFPLTLWRQILMVTQGAMKVEMPKMTSSMVSLVVCGIGCLALLIGLVLLVRVLRKSLKR